MISIEQIRVLEAKVHTAVERIESLSAENATLRSKLSEYEKRVADLQNRVEGFQNDQAAIEAGILSALDQLDKLEDRIGSDAGETSPSAGSSATVDHHQEAPSESAVPDEDEETGDGADLPSPTPSEGENEDGDPEDPELDIF
jgi:FtsZ-binding cell division protein ZapB